MATSRAAWPWWAGLPLLLVGLGAGLGWVSTTGALGGILGGRAVATALLLVLSGRADRSGAGRAGYLAALVGVLSSGLVQWIIEPQAWSASWALLDVFTLFPAAWLGLEAARTNARGGDEGRQDQGSRPERQGSRPES